MNDSSLRPMPIWQSLLYFGIPSVLATLGIYVLWPVMTGAGVPEVWCMTLCMGGALALMLVAALAAYGIEGNRWTWEALSERFRLKRMGGWDWLWALGLFVVFLVSFAGLQFTATWLASIPAFAPPDHLPGLLDPRVAKDAIPTEFLGIPLKGAWWVVARARTWPSRSGSVPASR